MDAVNFEQFLLVAKEGTAKLVILVDSMRTEQEQDYYNMSCAFFPKGIGLRGGFGGHSLWCSGFISDCIQGSLLAVLKIEWNGLAKCKASTLASLLDFQCLQKIFRISHTK